MQPLPSYKAQVQLSDGDRPYEAQLNDPKDIAFAEAQLVVSGNSRSASDPPGRNSRPVSEEPTTQEPTTTSSAAIDEGGPMEVPKTQQRRSCHSRRQQRILIATAIILSILVVIIIVALVVLLKAANTEEPIVQIGNRIDPLRIENFLGVSLAMSQTGDRMAVASPENVTVYELQVGGDWQPLGMEIALTTLRKQSTRLSPQDLLVQVAMNAPGDRIVVGVPNEGLVQVYRYRNLEWQQVGQNLTTNATTTDLLGFSVAINGRGNIIAVGVPGRNSGKGGVGVYQRDSDGDWGQLGDFIDSDDAQFVDSFGLSVSLSTTGDVVAAAGRTLPDPTGTEKQVVQVFGYDEFGNADWSRRGEIMAGHATRTTIWRVGLSGDGNRLVVSSAYQLKEDFWNVEPENLISQAFSYDGLGWRQLGKDIHANVEGVKWGFQIAYSEDGNVLAMGDPGTGEPNQNSRGHAHLYVYDGDWRQVGEDIRGAADEDLFGFAVAISRDGRRFCAGAPQSDAGSFLGGIVKVYGISE